MPDWKRLVQERLARLRPGVVADADLAEELSQHLEDIYREQLAAGVSEPEACRHALSELDDVHPLRAELERTHQMDHRNLLPAGASRGNFLEDLWRDLRYTARSMRRSPLFVLFVVLTLALGIGANSTVFTLINTMILNPIPVAEPANLLAVAGAPANAAQSSVPLPLSYSDLRDYQAANGVFSSLAAYTSARLVTLQAGGTSERMFSEFVTSAYFPTLGLRPAKGRFFAPQEDSSPGSHPVAVINYGTWQTRFGGSPDILGQTLRLNNLLVTIVGVAPPHFIGVNALFGPDFWMPASMAEAVLPAELQNVLTDRSKTAFLGVGRLQPGMSRTKAQANFTALSAALARDYPETHQGRTAVARPVRDVLFGGNGVSSSAMMMGSTVLMIVVGIVLLIACSNVANLLLARSAARQQEIAVRLAMGASRSRLMRQLLTESVTLGVLSGILGLCIGYAVLRLLWSALPSAANFVTPKFDATVFGFALVVSLLTGFLFGTIPAFKASRTGVAGALKDEARTAGRSRRKVTLANSLLVGQVAFSFLLLVTAALFLRSIGRAYEMDPGFQTAHLATFMTNPGQTGYSKPQTKAFYKDVRERAGRLPGVESVSWSSNLPLWARTVNRVQVEGRQQRSQADNLTSIVTTVDLQYFETAGVAIDRGRDFSSADQETSTPVAIVNEKMAHDYWPSGDALGKRIQLPDEPQMRVIVGIARTANYSNWGEPPQLCVYVPLEQKFSDAMVLFVRSKGDPRQVMIPVQREALAAGPKIVVSGVRTGREIIDGGLFQARMAVILLASFGMLALALACIGLYGIMAYSVSRRKREIGLRMALGASQSSVRGLILRQGMSLVLAGVAVGFAGSVFVGRVLSGMLYGVGATDPASVAGAGVVLSVVALAACYLPARWASRVDPLVALREG